jgi:hypothetical protein
MVAHEHDDLTTEERLGFLPRRERQGEGEKKRMEAEQHVVAS